LALAASQEYEGPGQEIFASQPTIFGHALTVHGNGARREKIARLAPRRSERRLGQQVDEGNTGTRKRTDVMLRMRNLGSHLL
jgi:hypothetical protein